MAVRAEINRLEVSEHAMTQWGTYVKQKMVGNRMANTIAPHSLVSKGNPKVETLVMRCWVSNPWEARSRKAVMMDPMV